MTSKLIPNSFQTPNYYADEAMSLLNGAELKVLLYTVRQTYGFRKDSERITLTEYCEGKVVGGERVTHGTGLSRGAVINALDMLLRSKLLLLVKKGAGRDGSEYGINLESSTIDLSIFESRQEAAARTIADKIKKANAGRRAKKTNKLPDAVRGTNHTNGSSHELQTVRPTNHKRFVPRTTNGSSHEPHLLLHGNSEETQLETQGESAPFDSFDFTEAASAYETKSEEVQAALRSIFPALPILGGQISNLTNFVMDLNAPASYVMAWPGWFQQRYAGQIASHFKFGDTFKILATEGLKPDAWLNGSIGARFVAAVTGSLGSAVTATTASRVTTVGHWLDAHLSLTSKDDWYQHGYVPDAFARFWASKFPESGKPSADSVMKYWQEFDDWRRANSASHAQSGKTCGQCENGWIMPANVNESARRCACQAKQ